MEKTLIIIAHPDFKSSIINKNLLEAVENEENISINHLSIYSDKEFDIKREQQLLLDHDRIIFQFPMYWYSYPSILKKWIDEVLTPGFAYGRKNDSFGTKLVNKHFSLVVSIGGDENMYTPGVVVGITIGELLKPLQATIQYIGGVYTYPFLIYESAFIKNKEHLSTTLERYKEYVSTKYIPKEKQYVKIMDLAYEHKAKGYY